MSKAFGVVSLATTTTAAAVHSAFVVFIAVLIAAKVALYVAIAAIIASGAVAFCRVVFAVL